MRSSALLLLFIATGAAAGPRPPDLERYCPGKSTIAPLWERGWLGGAVSAAGETGSVECLRFVLDHTSDPAKSAAEALGRLGEWDVRKSGDLKPVLGELMSRVDFGEKDSPAHKALLGLVKFQEYGLLDAALKRGANPNVNERTDRRGDSPLHLAARYGDDRAIEMLLKYGADINLPAGGGKTALHWAVGQKLPATVTLLLKNGADPDRKDIHGLTPYVCACGDTCGMKNLPAQGGGPAAEEPRVRMRQQILALLDPVTKQKPDRKYCNPESVTGGESLTRSQNLKHLGEMLSREAPPLLNLSDDGGSTPLNAAVFEDREAAFLLIKAGADVNIADRDGLTPLHRAARKGDVALVEALLKAGANPAATDRQGRLPLADAKGSEVAMLLTRGGKVPEKAGTDALFAAMARQDEATIAALLAHGVPLRGCGPQGYSLLAYALLDKDTRLFWDLLERGADIHQKCAEHNNLLVHALLRVRHDGAERGRVVMELVKRGADIHSAQTGSYADTPLIASIGRVPQLTEYLLDHGVDVNAMLPDGETALRAACRAGEQDLILRLLEAGADPNPRLPAGAHSRFNPPLLDAIRGTPRAVESLLVYGADPNVSDEEGNTALQLAVGARNWELPGNPRVALTLLQHGARPEPPAGLLPLRATMDNYDYKGDWQVLFEELVRRGAVPVHRRDFWPLHHAISIGRGEMIPVLLAAGEQPMATDANGKTAFQIAREHKCQECIELMRSPPTKQQPEGNTARGDRSSPRR